MRQAMEVGVVAAFDNFDRTKFTHDFVGGAKEELRNELQ
jgi:hypothetical protein